MSAEDNKAAARRLGDFLGTGRIGREVVVHGVTMERWENGRLVHETTGWDPAAILTQMDTEIQAIPVGQS